MSKIPPFLSLTLIMFHLFAWDAQVLASTPIRVALAPQVQARLKPKAVLQRALRAAERHGYTLTKFEAPRVPRFDSETRTWLVYFQGKQRTPGNHFMVTVDDVKETTEVYDGE